MRNRKILIPFILGITAFLVVYSSVFKNINTEKDENLKTIVLSLETEISNDFELFKMMKDEYILKGKELDINSYKNRLDESFNKIDHYKEIAKVDNIKCDENSDNIDKRLTFLNNTYNMLKYSEITILDSYSGKNYDRVNDILNCVNGHLRESFYDTKLRKL